MRSFLIVATVICTLAVLGGCAGGDYYPLGKTIAMQPGCSPTDRAKCGYETESEKITTARIELEKARIEAAKEVAVARAQASADIAAQQQAAYAAACARSWNGCPPVAQSWTVIRFGGAHHHH